MAEDVDETISNLLNQQFVRSKQREPASDFYDYNPLKSSYKCYTCQKQKSPKTSNGTTTRAKGKHSKKRVVLEQAKMNDIIIKPWHPFLREFQKFFKNVQQSPVEKQAVLRIYETIRRLRDQLLENLKLLESANLPLGGTLDVLATWSVSDIQCEFDGQITESIRFKLQDQCIKDLKEQVATLKETIYNLERSIPFKEQLQIIIKLSKEVAFLKAKLSETQALNAILQEEPVNLKEENYFLYYLVRLDRHELYKALMKHFRPENLRETEISTFEIYLQNLEKELAQERLQRSRLQRSQVSLEKQTEDIKKDSQNQFLSDLKLSEEKWSFERTRMESTLEQLRQEVSMKHRAEAQIRAICQSQAEELEKLKQQLHDCHNGMNNVSFQNLQFRQQNDALATENKDLKKALTQLEKKLASVAQPPLTPSEQAKELALIILSKERPNQQQTELLYRAFGDYTEQVIRQNFEERKFVDVVQGDQANKDSHLIQRLSRQNAELSQQLDAVRREIDVYNESQVHPHDDSLKNSDFVNPGLAAIQVIERINQIFRQRVQGTENLLVPSNNAAFSKLAIIDDLKCMLVLQAASIEHTFPQRIDDEELQQALSQSDDQPYQGGSNHTPDQFNRISEQEEEEEDWSPREQDALHGDDEEEEEEHSVHQPRPHQQDQF